jgi:hypothetical protein
VNISKGVAKKEWIMSIFKKKIYFPQFLADLINNQMDFLEMNFNNLIVMADEFRVLTDNQKEEFLDKAHELIIADIVMSCSQYFYKKMSSEEVGEAVSIIYGKYLTEFKKVSKTLALKKIEKVIELLEHISKAEEKAQEHDEYDKKIGYNPPYRIDNDIDKMKLYLCQAFRDYCVGEDVKSENFEAKHFAVFKFATAIVKGNVVAHALKQYAVIFR